MMSYQLKTLGPLVVNILVAGSLLAQPGGGSLLLSLETRIIQAPIVFRATISSVADTVIHTNNQFLREGIFTNKPVEPFDIHNYTVVLRVDEVLKGKVSPDRFEFHYNHVGKCTDFEAWADERASILWFAQKDSKESLEYDFFALQNFIYLGQMRLGQAGTRDINPFRPVYDRTITLLTKPADIMARARAFARKPVSVTDFHQVRLPQLSSHDHFFSSSYLTVPVEPTLEKTARHLIAAPGDFISTNEPALAREWRCDWRAEGASALRYFKSARNVRLLKSLLEAPDFWESEFWPANQQRKTTRRIYSVRRTAYEVLKSWGIDVSEPVTHG